MNDAVEFMTINGPELDHSALAEQCEKELVARILRGDKDAWEGFSEDADGHELACAVRDALAEGSDGDVVAGTLSRGIEKLSKEYAVGYVAHRADKGELEDLGREYGLIEDSE